MVASRPTARRASQSQAPAARVKVSTRLAGEIVDTISEAGLQPGDHYLSEAEALRRHGVSRGVYREALRFLERLGVITTRSGPGGGAVIAEPDADVVASILAFWLQSSRATMNDVLEARWAIEPGVARLAALHAGDDEIAAMRLDLADAETEIGNFHGFLPAYLSFWQRLAASTRNPLLTLLSPALRTIVNSAGFVPDEPQRLRILGHLHRILDAVAAHDDATADQAMRELEDDVNQRLRDGFPRLLQRTIPWTLVDRA